MQGIKPWSIHNIYRTGTKQLTRVMCHLTQQGQRHRLFMYMVIPIQVKSHESTWAMFIDAFGRIINV